jgi:tRNA threonylcarbamoyladenosine biosynthesis protein TsaE
MTGDPGQVDVTGEGSQTSVTGKPGQTGVTGQGSQAGVRAELTVASADEMLALGGRLAAVLLPGDLVLLGGPLGAGKTTLVQGIAAGLEVRGPVTSPTFVIARVHPSLAGGPALVHADAYRLASPAEVDDLDLDASLATSVTVVEWGGGLADGLSPDRLEVGITPADPGPGGPADAPVAGDWQDTRPRTVRLVGHGPRWNSGDPPRLLAAVARKHTSIP